MFYFMLFDYCMYFEKYTLCMYVVYNIFKYLRLVKNKNLIEN